MRYLGFWIVLFEGESSLFFGFGFLRYVLMCLCAMSDAAPGVRGCQWVWCGEVWGVGCTSHLGTSHIAHRT